MTEPLRQGVGSGSLQPDPPGLHPKRAAARLAPEARKPQQVPGDGGEGLDDPALVGMAWPILDQERPSMPQAEFAEDLDRELYEVKIGSWFHLPGIARPGRGVQDTFAQAHVLDRGFGAAPALRPAPPKDGEGLLAAHTG